MPHRARSALAKAKKHKLAIALASLIGLAAIIFAQSYRAEVIAWQLYPYFYPQHTCYLPDGTDTGRGQDCLMDGMQIIEQRGMGGWIDSAAIARINTACHSACQKNSACAHYVVGWPIELYSKITLPSTLRSFECSIVSGEPR